MQNHLLPFSLDATNFVLALIVLPTPQMTPNAIKAEVPPTLPGGAFFWCDKPGCPEMGHAEVRLAPETGLFFWRRSAGILL